MNKKLWLEELKGDPDELFPLEGIQNGFQIFPADSVLRPTEMNNYKSANGPDTRDKVEQALTEEVD